MTGADRFRRVDELFRAVVRLDDEKERAAFLREKCADDPTLIADVQLLLDEDATVRGALDQPALGRELNLETLRAADDSARKIPEAIGRYRVIRQLGLGGMGAVYEAEQRDPRRRVALKVVRAGVVTPMTLHRFHQEAQLLGQLTHPGIAQIYEAGTADSGEGPEPYFAMELVRGRPITDDAEANRLSLSQRLELIARVADALHHAHVRGIIHRDLKPANILVDDSGQPKILDFGIARATDADVHTVSMRTDVGQLVGTIAYMSPEQAEGDPAKLDTRSDVYSLGVIAYELLTGRLPYDVRDKMIHEAVRVIREVDPTAASTVSRHLAGDVETIISKALEKDPARRYPSAAALAEDIRRFLTDQPIIARPPSTWYQFRKFTKRNKAAVIGAACVFGALALGLAGTSAALVQTTSARDAEREERRRASNLAMAADAAATRAQQEAHKAERIAGFSRSMLTGITPDVARDEDTTLMRMILDDAAEQIEAELDDQPEIEASILLLIGQSYRAIAEPDLAAPHVERAIDLFRRELGEDHPETLAAIHEYTSVVVDRGGYQSAATMASELLERARRVLPDDDPLLVRIIMGYGAALNALGRSEEADRVTREALDRARTVLGEDDPLTISALHSMGLRLHAQQRIAESEPYFRSALEALERTGRRDDRVAMRISGHLAQVLAALDRIDEAEAMFDRTIEAQRRVLGDQHHETLETLSAYGMMLTGMQRLAEAEAVHREVLDRSRQSRGEDHPVTLQSMNHLAFAIARQGRLDEAEAMFRASMDAHRRVFGDEHRHALQAVRSLVDFLRFRGKIDEAVTLSEEMIAMARAALPADDWQLGWQLAVRGRVLLDAGLPGDAEPVLAEAVEILSAAVGEDERRTRIARAALAESRAERLNGQSTPAAP